MILLFFQFHSLTTDLLKFRLCSFSKFNVFLSDDLRHKFYKLIRVYIVFFFTFFYLNTQHFFKIEFMVLFVYFFIGLSRDSLFFLITIFCSFYLLMSLIFFKKNFIIQYLICWEFTFMIFSYVVLLIKYHGTKISINFFFIFSFNIDFLRIVSNDFFCFAFCRVISISLLDS